MARGADGRFLAGASGNPGGKKVHCHYKALIEVACTGEEWTQIVVKAVEDAIKGDRFARRFLADYLVGRPSAGFGEQPVVIGVGLLDSIEKVYGAGD